MAGPYFPPLTVAGARIVFDHLEPIRLEMATQARPKGIVIDVRFSNHCFSETFEGQHHGDEAVVVMDGRNRRVFSPERYALSHVLPDIIRGLPSARVYQTPEANFVRIEVRPDGLAGDYRMFFRVKRAQGESHDLKLFVESAYGPEPGRALPIAHMSRVRFAVLVDKVLKGERLKFHQKR